MKITILNEVDIFKDLNRDGMSVYEKKSEMVENKKSTVSFEMPNTKFWCPLNSPANRMNMYVRAGTGQLFKNWILTKSAFYTFCLWIEITIYAFLCW